MNISAIVFGQGEGRLELARQVGLAVNRLDRIVAGCRYLRIARVRRQTFDLFAVEPNLPVGSTTAGAQCDAQRERVGIQVVANRVEEGRRAAQHVALDVTARRQGRQQASLIWRIVVLQVVL